MKTLIFILVIASFLQSTILPIDLVLLILLCRSYLQPDKSNLLLAFAFGLLDSHLTLNTIGFHSLIYLTLVGLTETLSKSRLAGNPILIIPLSFILISIYQITQSIITSQLIQLFPKSLLEAFISFPILYLIRLWEERFIVRKGIKLRM